MAKNGSKNRGKQFNTRGQASNKYRGNSGSKPSSSRARNNKDWEAAETTSGHDNGCNDVSWYAKNEQILRDTASFSFNNPLGAKINWGDFKTAIDLQVDPGAESIPGIMAIRFMPTIGVSKDNYSPINIAAQNIYSFVRYHNSGAKNYDQQDLMLYILAMDSCYYMWNYGQRAYGILNTYSQTNRYLPRALFEAMGFDYEDFIAHIADFRALLNTLAAKLSAFCVPGNMPYITRHSWMCSNVYADSTQAKSQFYLMKPLGAYVFDETSSEKGGFLKWRYFGAQWTFATYSTFMNDMIARLLLSEDIGIMSGDVKKAYGDSGLFMLSKVTEDFTVTPVYNPEVLNQIHNSNALCRLGVSPLDSTTVDITQDPNTNALIYNPKVVDPYSSIPRFINMFHDNVTPADIMVGTRLTAMIHPEGKVEGEKTVYEFGALGSDIVFSYDYYTIVNGEVESEIGSSYLVSETEGAVSTDDVAIITKATNFDWHPLIYMIEKANVPNSPYYMRGVIGDISNYTLMSAEDLRKLHETALLSMFNIPQLGAF